MSSSMLELYCRRGSVFFELVELAKQFRLEGLEGGAGPFVVLQGRGGVAEGGVTAAAQADEIPAFGFECEPFIAIVESAIELTLFEKFGGAFEAILNVLR